MDTPATGKTQSLPYILKEWLALSLVIFGSCATVSTLTNWWFKDRVVAILVSGAGPMMLLAAAILFGFRFSLSLMLLTVLLSACLMCWTGAQY
jgi:hypothetical protein